MTPIRLWRGLLPTIATLLIFAPACGGPGGGAGPDAGGPGGDAANLGMDGMVAAEAGDSAGPSEDAPMSDAADGSGGTGSCPGSGDPVACDDGTGSLGTKTACPLSTDPGAAASYHLKVSGSKFATSGACLYVTASSCSSPKGDILQFSGGGGTGVENKFNPMLDAAPYCFRLLDVQWDTDWEDDGMTTGGPVSMGGDVLAASQKPQALIAWVHDFERTSPATPFCARGNSAGSSELLYELMHNGGETLLDHVQIISATPFGRIDKGCDPASPAEGTNVACSALPATTEPQYNGASLLVRTITHDPNCDTTGGSLGASERASLQAMSLVTSGFAPLTLHQTSLSAYMCSNMPNATQGQAVDVFGVNADLATAGIGTYTGLISLDLATAFYSCGASTACPPHVVCGADCSGEGYGGSTADRTELLTDLETNCVQRH
jgi:hypothetical protein